MHVARPEPKHSTGLPDSLATGIESSPMSPQSAWIAARVRRSGSIAISSQPLGWFVDDVLKALCEAVDRLHRRPREPAGP